MAIANTNKPPAHHDSEAMVCSRIRGGLYQVAGGVANVFFYVGSDEVVLVDSKIAPAASAQVVAEVRKISNKPIRRVLITHGDGDHVNGLSGYPAPLSIIAQENTRQGMVNVAAPAVPVPNEAFVNRMSIYAGDTEIRMLYFGPAHTSGDAIVYIPAEKAAIVGDLIFVGRDPLIHRQKGGSSVGLVANLKAVLELDADVFLSGHGEPVDRQVVESLIAQVEGKRQRVAELIEQGKSLDDVKVAMGVADGEGRRWPSLAEIIYREMTEVA